MPNSSTVVHQRGRPPAGRADGKVFLASAEGKITVLKITVLKAGNTWDILKVNDIGNMILVSSNPCHRRRRVLTRQSGF
jgi:hypothetical protein